jgi:propanol-preferring alcohol dehydrogenase
MLAMRLLQPGPVEDARLVPLDLPVPRPTADGAAVLLKVLACGVCHTDLHLVEGDLPAHHLPLTPGHQVVAEVADVAPGTDGVRLGDVGATGPSSQAGTPTAATPTTFSPTRAI